MMLYSMGLGIGSGESTHDNNHRPKSDMLSRSVNSNVEDVSQLSGEAALMLHTD